MWAEMANKSKKSLAVLTDKTALRRRFAWHVF